MTFGSLFSGIGGFDLGFERAGMTCAWQVECEPFCQKVLRYWFTAPVFDDVLTVGAANLEPVDVLCGGFPCQDVSVAGKGEGLDGERSGLFFEFVRISAEMRPRWVVIENVPGLLTNRQGKDFHTVLTTLAERGFRRSYRILDSRYFGVAQRRRRVFLVCCLGTSGDDPRSVLFESESGERRAAPSREARAHLAATLRGRSARSGVNVPGRGGEDDENIVAFNWQSGGDCRLDPNDKPMLHGGQTPAVAFSLTQNDRNKSQGPANYIVAKALETTCGDYSRADGFNMVAATLTSTMGKGALDQLASDNLQVADTLLAPSGGSRSTDLNGNYQVSAALRSGHRGTDDPDRSTHLASRQGVRRLTPLECERVQGFPDGWTCLCGERYRGSKFCSCPDTPRYKALGNAVTVPVAEWIGRRLMQASA